MTHATERRRLPANREGFVHKASACGYEFYLTCNFYSDSADPGELFVVIAKEGSVIAGLMDGWAITVSMALQYGVPWSVLRDKYRGTRFGEPNADPKKPVTSLLDAIAQAVEELINVRQHELVQRRAVEEAAGAADCDEEDGGQSEDPTHPPDGGAGGNEGPGSAGDRGDGDHVGGDPASKEQ